jgi:hypothetical protein
MTQPTHPSFHDRDGSNAPQGRSCRGSVPTASFYDDLGHLSPTTFTVYDDPARDGDYGIVDDEHHYQDEEVENGGESDDGEHGHLYVEGKELLHHIQSSVRRTNIKLTALDSQLTDLETDVEHRVEGASARNHVNYESDQNVDDISSVTSTADNNSNEENMPPPQGSHPTITHTPLDIRFHRLPLTPLRIYSTASGLDWVGSQVSSPHSSIRMTAPTPIRRAFSAPPTTTRFAHNVNIDGAEYGTDEELNTIPVITVPRTQSYLDLAQATLLSPSLKRAYSETINVEKSSDGEYQESSISKKSKLTHSVSDGALLDDMQEEHGKCLLKNIFSDQSLY